MWDRCSKVHPLLGNTRLIFVLLITPRDEEGSVWKFVILNRTARGKKYQKMSSIYAFSWRDITLRGLKNLK